MTDVSRFVWQPSDVTVTPPPKTTRPSGGRKQVKPQREAARRPRKPETGAAND